MLRVDVAHLCVGATRQHAVAHRVRQVVCPARRRRTETAGCRSARIFRHLHGGRTRQLFALPGTKIIERHIGSERARSCFASRRSRAQLGRSGHSGSRMAGCSSPRRPPTSNTTLTGRAVRWRRRPGSEWKLGPHRVELQRFGAAYRRFTVSSSKLIAFSAYPGRELLGRHSRSKRRERLARN